MNTYDIVIESLSFDIQIFDISTYTSMIDEYIRNFSKQPGILCIAQYGNITTPGISDIDLLVICEDRYYHSINHKSETFIKQSPIHKYLFWHNVIVVPKSILGPLQYIHSLENLRVLWGDEDVFKQCEQLDDIIRVFRTILWNSFFWSLVLPLCGKKHVSLRLLCLLFKNLLISASNNSYFFTDESCNLNLTSTAEKQRRDILNADQDEQINLAKTYFAEDLLVFLQSECKLNEWLFQRGLSTEINSHKKLWISCDNIVIFDNNKSINQCFHQHVNGNHITKLPFFYYTLGFHVARPYFKLNSSLAKVWNIDLSPRMKYSAIYSKSKKWSMNLMNMFERMVKLGINPISNELVEFPFNLKRKTRGLKGLVKKVVSIK